MILLTFTVFTYISLTIQHNGAQLNEVTEIVIVCLRPPTDTHQAFFFLKNGQVRHIGTFDDRCMSANEKGVLSMQPCARIDVGALRTYRLTCTDTPYSK